MLGLLLPVLAASAIAALRVGSISGLQRQRIYWWPLAFGSITLQLVLFNPPVDRQGWATTWGPWIWTGSLGALLIVLVRNGLTTRPGRTAFHLAALGVAANLFVVVANGGYMPQSPDARLAVHGTPLVIDGERAQLRDVAPSGPQTRFPWLGDLIAQPAWLPTANVVSIGDLVLSTALALWAFRVITTGRPTQVRRRSADSH